MSYAWFIAGLIAAWWYASELKRESSLARIEYYANYQKADDQ